MVRAQVLAEADTFWQTRTGQLILDTGRLPGTDPFSWTAAGRPWRPNSWAFDVVLGLAYRAGELTGVRARGSGVRARAGRGAALGGVPLGGAGAVHCQGLSLAED